MHLTASELLSWPYFTIPLFGKTTKLTNRVRNRSRDITDCYYIYMLKESLRNIVFNCSFAIFEKREILLLTKMFVRNLLMSTMRSFFPDFSLRLISSKDFRPINKIGNPSAKSAESSALEL
jgi:hypothetical protein